MKKFTLLLLILLASTSLLAQEFNPIPRAWKWINNKEVAFSYTGSYTADKDFAILPYAKYKKIAVYAPEKYTSYPICPQGAVNLTYSPDSTMLAFTRNNNLFIVDIASKKETQLTFDGSELILNGYASWVYYEEIFGRPSNYKAFWWSPDSKKIGFYRFDNSMVPMFPIYSAKGQNGKLIQTRYPKAGEKNPEVKIGIVNISDNNIIWADFQSNQDQYFGTPFWGKDSKNIYISREPRTQNELDLYAVSAKDGSKKLIYHEQSKTWLDWITGMLFGENGLYMARCFETGWSQIYYLSYDGSICKRLTDGENWRIDLLKVNEKSGDVFFTAQRDSRVRQGVYKVNKKGVITALTDTSLNASNVAFSPDGKYFVASLSNYNTPYQIWLINAEKPNKDKFMVANFKGPDYNPKNYALPRLITIKTRDGLTLPGTITYPFNFDPNKKYPVHVDIYGGPDTPLVKDRYIIPNSNNQWWAQMGIIQVVADCRAAGHNGKIGLDYIYRKLDQIETQDFVDWANYLQSLPYVNPNKIGVEGFSFGGTMTCLLLMNHSDKFHYGIAGGGVYDWHLYDSHYTERFMDTPKNNPKGYEDSKVINYVKNYVTKYSKPYEANNVDKVNKAINQTKDIEPVMLKITHGTGDDNVHFQNTLQLIDALQACNAKFDFMIYPDGMHGYGGYQGAHFNNANKEFWIKYLLN